MGGKNSGNLRRLTGSLFDGAKLRLAVECPYCARDLVIEAERGGDDVSVSHEFPVCAFSSPLVGQSARHSITITFREGKNPHLGPYGTS
jgi:ssDNA-binding Zn-finger/Zn-ribbon topoisomerase 1